MQLVLVFLLAAVIAGVAIMLRKQKEDELVGQGKAIHRKLGFWEEAEVFSTNTPYEAVLEAVKGTDYSEMKATVYPNVNGEQAVLWKSTHAWNAMLKYTGEKEGKQTYRFAFTGWKTRNGGVYSPESMNMMVTSVEKMLLSLDPSTTVETHKMQLKTNSRLF